MTPTDVQLGLRPTRDGTRTLTLVVVSMAVAGWVWLAVDHGGGHGAATGSAAAEPLTPWCIVTGHTGPAHGHVATGVPGPVGWYAGWLVMVVAMMLPPALPLLRVARRLTARAPRPALLVVACGAGFLAAWAATGLAMLLGSAALLALGSHSPWLADHAVVPSGIAAIVAGVYQFTPWKKACLRACRSPLGIAMTTWTGVRSRRVEATLLGLRYGAVCVGCCWALMLLTFAVGTAALPLMVIVGLAMAAERMVPRVRPLVPGLALAAIGCGLLILTGVLPPGLTTT